MVKKGNPVRKCWILLFLLILMASVSGCVKSTLTPEDVLRDRESLLWQRINVIGTAGIYKTICTQAICPEEDPCCNGCSGQLVLGSDGNMSEAKVIVLKGVYEGKEVKCWGTECEMLCHPMARGIRYSVTGTWKESSGEYYLELEHLGAV